MRRLLLSIALLLAGCSGGGGGAALPPVSQAPIQQPAPFAVIGDSISAGHFDAAAQQWVLDLPNSWPAIAAAIVGRPVINASISGAQEPEMTSDVALIPANATTVVFAGGTNDTYWGTAPLIPGTPGGGLTQSQVVGRLDDIVARIHAQAPQAKILFLNVRRYASVVKRDAASRDLETAWNTHERELGPVVDIQDRWLGDTVAYPDGCHPSLAQAQVLGQMMAAVLR